MAKGLAAVTAEIDRRLTAARSADNPNRIAAFQLRAWATDYLRDQDAEAAQVPGRGVRRHWNLWMREVRSSDGLFAVLVFGPGGIEFFCGTGPAYDVRWFCTAGSPPDPAAVFAAMQERFDVPEEPYTLDRPTAEGWLRRPRPW
jgi:hypothetical protein